MVYSMRPMPSHLCAESPNRYFTPANKEASKQVTAKVSALPRSLHTRCSLMCVTICEMISYSCRQWQRPVGECLCCCASWDKRSTVAA